MRNTLPRTVLSIALLAVLLASTLLHPAAPASATAGTPVVALYYAWFDHNSWNPSTISDLPIEPYSSADRGVIERHVSQARSAGVDAFALNWWGPNNPTDSNLRTLLDVAGNSGFQVSIDFDMNSPFIHGPADVAAYLNYASQYFSHPAWFKLNGKPVVMFFGNRKFDVGTWAQIRSQADGARSATWIGEGDVFSYLSVFDGIHPYSIGWSPDPAAQLASYASRTRSYGSDKLWVATVMPGYDDTRLGRGSAGYARSRDGGAYYRDVWQGAIATRPAFVSITSWNEFPEGSMIEPARGYGDLYLRITREYSDRLKSGQIHAPSVAQGPAAGRFYTEAGQGRGGFGISNDSGIRLLDSFDALGGVNALGFPCTQRFTLADGFNYQTAQGALLQWRPEYGRAVLANTFEMLQNAGKDTWLDEAKGIPRPITDDGSGGDWQKARDTRLGWLTNDAIRAKYMSAGSVERAIELYGLPMSRPEQRGPFVVQRFQRIAFQQWTDAVAGMPAPGSVVRILGGDLLKEAGLVPQAATVPVGQ